MVSENGVIAVIDRLINFNLSDFIICENFARGSFGQVFEGYHVETLQPVVVKFTQRHDMNDSEYNIMNKVNEKAKLGEFAKPYLSGKVLVKDPILKSSIN